MTDALSPSDIAKRASALRAAEFVEPGMRVGLGTGSTAAFLVQRLGERLRSEGLRIRGVPTSARTADLAQAEGIEVTTLEEVGWLDITIDGADEVDGRLDLIKGGGGALLREKIVATASERVVIIADAGKRVGTLGAFPLPVEVIPFGLGATRRLVEDLLAGADVGARQVELRLRDGRPFVTDEGNHILDLRLERIGNARQLSLGLNQIPGVVENGLFLGIADTLVVGRPDGGAEVVDMSQADGVPFAGTDNIFTEVVD
ncbi:ribose-5-phosphate isomerase RpiA [Rubellimicrobium rubrum]|uniref:Ribose-5-phosphate isomerase A n=1 Tax=Rubellimicrobium rubrum TaxID=2585369 RepID=A0A5C4MV78_9RHOB|nr:ribose-5-phosphate isomerase RpiA [Rubellimicrobium rubrum]TNC48016.1 ribose-5-phosphate isomerase RpiA [Rubellimicrobium rubrum]